MTTIDIFGLIKRANKAEQSNGDLLDKIAELEARVKELEEELDIAQVAAVDAVMQASRSNYLLISYTDCKACFEDCVGFERLRRRGE